MGNLIFTIATLMLGSIDLIYQEEPTQKILGTWYSEGSRATKWIYYESGDLHKYLDNELSTVFKYSISHSCGSDSDNEFYFIKWVDSGGTEFCYEINGINENNTGILSITSMKTGRISLFER